nr:MAG TPA: hypothetical protein [Caudoviricetes sp.]
MFAKPPRGKQSPQLGRLFSWYPGAGYAGRAGTPGRFDSGSLAMYFLLSLSQLTAGKDRHYMRRTSPYEVLCANTGAREATGLFAPALFFFRVCWRVSSAEPPRVKWIAPYHPRWRGSRPQGRSGPGLYAV